MIWSTRKENNTNAIALLSIEINAVENESLIVTVGAVDQDVENFLLSVSSPNI